MILEGMLTPDSRTWRIEVDHILFIRGIAILLYQLNDGGDVLWHAGSVNERYQDDEDPLQIFIVRPGGSYDPNDKWLSDRRR
jgi:hypothetical protein